MSRCPQSLRRCCEGAGQTMFAFGEAKDIKRASFCHPVMEVKGGFLISRSKHHQHGGAKQWNPPPVGRHTDLPLGRTENTVSATECTGLEAQPVISDTAAQSYAQLYGIHAQKTQGNIGKGNPNNDPSEIAFHRSEK